MTSEGFWLLARSMYGNIAEDRRALTIDVTNGVSIAMGGKDVHREWAAQHEIAAPPTTENAAAAQQLGAIMRLQSLFGRQTNPALRNAIKVKRPD